jgi:calcineurin-like phosphoesterase family protein
MKIWFTSDFHLFHKNIIRYENRPFKSVEEMNATIIQNFNQRVKEDDLVYFLGDFAFYASKNKAFRGEGMPIRSKEILNQLNGRWVNVKGNHDKSENHINVPTHRVVLNKGGIYINLVHRPQDTIIYDYDYYYPLSICGHVHSKWVTKEIERDGKISLCVNVSVENNKYFPYSFDEIMTIYNRWLSSHPRRKEINGWIIKSRTRPIYNRGK